MGKRGGILVKRKKGESDSHYGGTTAAEKGRELKRGLAVRGSVSEKPKERIFHYGPRASKRKFGGRENCRRQ